MAFFPRAFYNNSDDTSFTPLFRLLDDFDNYSRQQRGTSNGHRRSGLPTWQPKFDLRETGDAYELHGELPGMTKENVTIEFADPQSMTIRGKVERTYTAGIPPAGQIEDTTTSGAITEGTDATRERRNSHQATVEDETDGATNETGWEDVSKKSDGQKQLEKSTNKKPADKAKYWLAERSIGEFSRSFTFPTRVDQDGVSASLKDGLLSVTVPKARKPEARRINIL
ncbi:30 kDa heat shock protein-like protein [Hapsidospora chrysogenum ATCC 11550]|uniref:30 kDa heat shock protein-like protein n=1 Tax=Hapsidospora chrysogenum (strain ATCC 11550 / CBS 779.69 / DSM 880 / IAM 14645 / JCM 23072 / IMI 49137) TaxID=857340 RepID=A0A086SVP0_HAPC1|nr:30 kDa heat shock protein-like protein [Hapsidospora chrysogenum ATCC 11550]